MNYLCGQFFAAYKNYMVTFQRPTEMRGKVINDLAHLIITFEPGLLRSEESIGYFFKS